MPNSATKSKSNNSVAMPKMLHRGDAKTGHRSALPEMGQLSWDDVRVFLACASDKSFRKASKTLRLSSSTVVRRIDRLEASLRRRLFDRLPNGVELTNLGKEILQFSHEMEKAGFNIVRKCSNDDWACGLVSVSITEGLGSFWVMPQLVEFQRNHPNITLNLRCAMESADVLRLEADMAIQFQRPTNPDLIAVKLGRLHVYPFASQSYIDIYGRPTSSKDMLQHRLVQQVAPQLDDDAWAKFLGVPDLQGIVGIRTNASTAHFYAVEKGAGIGVLPTFAVALDAPVVPIDIGGSYHLDIWLTFHPDIRKTPRKSLVIDWLKSIFDAKIYPWFRDEFIHPDELVKISPNGIGPMSGRGHFAATLSGLRDIKSAQNAVKRK